MWDDGDINQDRAMEVVGRMDLSDMYMQQSHGTQLMAKAGHEGRRASGGILGLWPQQPDSDAAHHCDCQH